MSWARLDDRFHGNRKIRTVWKACPQAIGLHVMAITYCAQHETDGHVDDDFLEITVPRPRDRESWVQALTAAGLWHRNGTGWNLNDFLKYNPSHEKLEAKRESERARREAAA